MSLCDRCFAPGACCKGMTFNLANDQPDAAEAQRAMKRQEIMQGTPMPFVPWQRVRSREHGEFWRWRCTAVTAEGRCSIYEDRPKLCRSFEPASDRLCVHFEGAEAGDPTAPL